MPRNKDIKKVLVIGSGPIIIGQAAEFDYAGTQACRSLKEEGIEVVLLNSNPATIMTDKDIADRVYIEPLTVEVVEQLILKEKPDSILPTLGGQAGLNLAMELEEAGILKANNVRLIGTTALTIKKAEDREMFKETMEKIGEPVAPSEIVEDVNTGLAVVKETLKIEKEHPGTFPAETIAFDYDVLKRTNGLHLDDLSKRIAEQNHQLVNAYQEMYRPLLQLKGSIFSKIYSETGESADNILDFERKNQ